MGRAELYGAVARAIGDLQGERSFWADSAERRDERLAAAAISVVLAEATRSIEALADRKADSGAKAQRAGRAGVADRRFEESRMLREEALAVLAALGEPA